MQVPLIGAIYENDPNVGLYTLPLLIYYPLQLLVGAILVPRLKNFVKEENERLGILDYDSETEDDYSQQYARRMSEKHNSVYEWNLEEPKSERLSEELLFNETLKISKANDESVTDSDSDSECDAESNIEARDFVSFEKMKTGTQLSKTPSFTGILRIATEPETRNSGTKEKLFVRFNEILTEEFTFMGEKLEEPVVDEKVLQVKEHRPKIKRRKKTTKSGGVKKKQTKKKKSKLKEKKSLVDADKIDGSKLTNKLGPESQLKAGLKDVGDRSTKKSEAPQRKIQEAVVELVESPTFYPEVIDIENMIVSNTCCDGFDELSDLDNSSTANSCCSNSRIIV